MEISRIYLLFVQSLAIYVIMFNLESLYCILLNKIKSNQNPHTVKYIESIEGVQRRATKMIPEIKKLSYPERLKYLRLPTMAYRRSRGGYDRSI